ncbi:hypothetical protein GCM10022252_20060 [Streptosporangium oxazolinicum]|uniref:Uncharacterized protein n=1 Tax=Streptosporangium oxazolinicum TaxID=909287 RepID=A0ABP8APD8_9ACTN
MHVDLIASTHFNSVLFEETTGLSSDPWATSADQLAEAATELHRQLSDVLTDVMWEGVDRSEIPF